MQKILQLSIPLSCKQHKVNNFTEGFFHTKQILDEQQTELSSVILKLEDFLAKEAEYVKFQGNQNTVLLLHLSRYFFIG